MEKSEEKMWSTFWPLCKKNFKTSFLMSLELVHCCLSEDVLWFRWGKSS